MYANPPDSQVVRRLVRTFPASDLQERADTVELRQRHRKLDPVAFFWTLVFGFAAGHDRTIQALLDRYLATADEDALAYNSFSNWFSPALLTFLRELLEEQLEGFEPRHDQLAGRLARFRDVLIADGTFVTLVQSAADVFPAFREDHAGCKVQLTESLARGLPTRFEVTDAHTHDRSALQSGRWVEDALVLLDLGFYDFWLFDRIDANGGFFVTRLKTDANPLLVEELRTWRGNAIPLKGKHLQDVVDDRYRDVIDVRAAVSFQRRAYRGSRSMATKCFRLVGLWNDDEDRYHLYLTNLDAETFDAGEIGLLYRARWEVEWTFKVLKSWFRLDDLRVSNPVIIEALLLVAALSLVVSRVILDELRELETQPLPTDDTEADNDDENEPEESVRERLSRRRGSLAVQRFGGLIHQYVMLELGYDLPDLDELLLMVAREPNPHRDRLRWEVETGPVRPGLA